ncbi:MAG: 50S ribosomal protein L2 [Nitrososphaeria archaeon]|jgi:large subunit ribosomal protein L2
MGKRILVQRRGRGGSQFRARKVGKIAPVSYPSLPPEETHQGVVEDIVHERGRQAPLARLRFDDGTVTYVPAVAGLERGATLHMGPEAPLSNGNILPLWRIPEGTIVSNIERAAGDGGELVRAPGASAVVLTQQAHGSVIVKLPSGNTLELDRRARATIGVVAGGGKGEKPLLKAGNKWRLMRARGRKYPLVRGVAMTTVYHPFGGGRHQHPGHPTTVSRNAPPGAKVGNIAARKTGRGGVRGK